MVQMLKQGEDVQTAKKRITAKAQLPQEFLEARQRMADMLQTKVQLTCSAGGKGKISIPFADAEDLKRILSACGLN